MESPLKPATTTKRNGIVQIMKRYRFICKMGGIEAGSGGRKKSRNDAGVLGPGGPGGYAEAAKWRGDSGKVLVYPATPMSKTENGVYVEELNFSHTQSEGRMAVRAGIKVVDDEGLLDLTAEFEIDFGDDASWNDIKHMACSRIRRALQQFPE